MVVEHTSVIGYEHKFRGGGACVDAKVCVTGVCAKISVFQVELLMPVNKALILCLRVEKRLSRYNIIRGFCVLNLFNNVIYGEGVLGCSRIYSTAVSYEYGSLLWKYRIAAVKS